MFFPPNNFGVHGGWLRESLTGGKAHRVTIVRREHFAFARKFPIIFLWTADKPSASPPAHSMDCLAEIPIFIQNRFIDSDSTSSADDAFYPCDTTYSSHLLKICAPFENTFGNADTCKGICQGPGGLGLSVNQTQTHQPPDPKHQIFCRHFLTLSLSLCCHHDGTCWLLRLNKYENVIPGVRHLPHNH